MVNGVRDVCMRDVDVYNEQPCRSYEDCLTVRRRTPLPFILDENIDGLAILKRAIADGEMDAVNLKISKDGCMTASDRPWHGLEPVLAALGKPVLSMGPEIFM